MPFALRLAAALLAFVAAGRAAGDEMAVNVDKRGPLVVVDVTLQVPAPVADTWAVWTDFERMPAFLPNLKHSKVTRREGNQLQLEQRSETRIAFMSFEVHTLRRVDLQPMQEIRTQLISGDFKSYTSSTRLVDKGAHTLVVYHGEYVPATLPPPLVGRSIVESHTRKHFQQMADEVMRRRGEGAAQK